MSTPDLVATAEPSETYQLAPCTTLHPLDLSAFDPVAVFGFAVSVKRAAVQTYLSGEFDLELRSGVLDR